MSARTVGPVTASAGAGYAAAVVLVYVAEQLSGRDVPATVEDALGLLLLVVGGWLVRPKGAHIADG